MSPPPSTRAQSRRHRSLVISLAIVIVVSFGALAGTLAAKWSPKLGLDLAGGLSVVYEPAHKVSQSDLDETVTILNNRVNGLGVSGATVETQGGDVVVQVPGVTDARKVLHQIGETAQLLFRPTLCYAPPYSAKAAKQAAAKAGTATATKKGAPVSPGPLPANCPTQYQLVRANLTGSTSSSNGVGYAIGPYQQLAAYPSTPSTADDKSKTVLLPGLPGSGSNRYLLGPAELTGRAVKTAVAQQTQAGQWVVNVSMTSKGSTGWDNLARKYFHEIIGIELDGVVQSAPITLGNQASFTPFDGQVQIYGSFTQASAQNLALALQFGSLPVRLVPRTTQTVSPTLGQSSLQAGLGAGIAGLVLVLLYAILYYRLLGIVVVSGLAVTAALLWAIISALGHTAVAPSFDLAGVTGIIVSIGITVDSYIVYFERLKDETRAGRSVRTSVDRGFKSAWRTVLAADLVSLAAAVVLFYVAVGQVKGFAFFLGLSTLLDIVITYYFTRPVVVLLGRSERLTGGRRMSIARGLNVPPPAAPAAPPPARPPAPAAK